MATPEADPLIRAVELEYSAVFDAARGVFQAHHMELTGGGRNALASVYETANPDTGESLTIDYSHANQPTSVKFGFVVSEAENGEPSRERTVLITRRLVSLRYGGIGRDELHSKPLYRPGEGFEPGIGERRQAATLGYLAIVRNALEEKLI